MRSLRQSLIRLNFSAFGARGLALDEYDRAIQCLELLPVYCITLNFVAMYVINDLRLNDFVLVPIPSPKQLFERLGEMNMISPGSSDGEFCEPVNVCSNKLSELEKGQRYAELAYYDSLRQNEPPMSPGEEVASAPEE